MSFPPVGRPQLHEKYFLQHHQKALDIPFYGHFMSHKCLIFIIFYAYVWIFLTWILSEEWDLAFGRDLRPTPLIPFPVRRLMTSQCKRRLCSWCGCPLSRRPCRQWHTWPCHGVKKMLVTLIKSGCLCRTTNGLLGNPVAIQNFGWPKRIEGRGEKQHKVSCKVTFVHLMLFLTKFLT